MANFTSFFEWLLSVLQNFLLSEPIIYFVGAVLMLFIVKIFAKIINVR